MIKIKARENKQTDDVLNKIENIIERLIETNEIIEIVVEAEFKIHIDNIDPFSDELTLLVDKYKK